MTKILILGATSDMARATGIVFLQKGYEVQLAGRDVEALQAIAQDFSVRSAKSVSYYAFDACDAKSTDYLWAELQKDMPDMVLCAVGLLGEQSKAQVDMKHAQAILQSNFTGLVSILSKLADAFELRRSGVIIGVSSVAGERGRASNYVYGSAKAGFTAFLSGLRNRLAKSGVQVLTVKPGFVATRMTEGMDLPPLLTAKPEEVAEAILKAVENGKDSIYVKWMWRWIMLIIKCIPEKIFKKINL